MLKNYNVSKLSFSRVCLVLQGFDREFLMTPVFKRTNRLRYSGKNACKLITLYPIKIPQEIIISG